MTHQIFKIPVLSFVFRTAKAIPIAPAHEDAAMLERADAGEDLALLLGTEEIGAVEEARRRVAHPPSILTVGGRRGFCQDSAPP